jgi:hypothetical protein
VELASDRTYGIGGSSMIDNPTQVDRLMGKLQQALPLPARTTPELLAALAAQNAASQASAACSITWISYAGDEGGVVCRLDFGDEAKNAAFVSITHLRFDARLPLAREITAYQKHRVKRLQRRSA